MPRQRSSEGSQGDAKRTCICRRTRGHYIDIRSAVHYKASDRVLYSILAMEGNKDMQMRGKSPSETVHVH